MTGFDTQHLDMHYVVMESSPVDWRPVEEDGQQRFTWAPGMQVMPGVSQERFLLQTQIKEARLLHVDEAECALCTEPIGYVSTEPEDSPHVVARWIWTTAVYYGRVHDVLFLCENCSPHSIRDLFE